MAFSSSNATGGTIDGVGATTQQGITTEVPEILKKLALFLVKAFYGKEHYVVFDYIQRNVCTKEDKLRDLLKMDQKCMRQILVTLKVDKFIKERMVSEEAEGQRARKVNYYFVHYKALLSVARYKFDHMRTKLEGLEKNNVQRSIYRCSNANCKKQYDAMDIGKIFDPSTSELRCWQCSHIVTADEAMGPSDSTRSSMAKFNEQASGMFSILQSLDGIRFSHDILEPPLADAVKEQPNEGQKILKVGERAFNSKVKTRKEMFGGEITVQIGDEVERSTKTKEAVPWLQTNQHQSSSSSTNLLLNDPSVMMDFSTLPSTLDPMLSAEHTSVPTTSTTEADGPAGKKPKYDDIDALLMEEDEGTTMEDRKREENNHSGDDEEEDYVMVQGKRVLVSGLSNEHIALMTPSEKSAYIASMQSPMAEFW